MIFGGWRGPQAGDSDGGERRSNVGLGGGGAATVRVGYAGRVKGRNRAGLGN